MRAYSWKMSSWPELAGLSGDERMRLWRRAVLPSLRHWPVWAALLAPVAVPILLQVARGHLVAENVAAGIGWAFAGLALQMGGVVLFVETLTRVARRYIRTMREEQEPK
jgi:hypothetical protein